ncbi:GNAT family N-acetyltransferase [Mangrovimicrobium sediminis]|uniref:GNAT family N-acetyltransferase n=1 Tax=Mangrovimicrobium sediminis TaxID=2562682 RepID=A0A4Z0LWF5_9GAMM|nr:peptidase C39 family protein [Haliea sp. SAOS-164]TGD71611.1 GNAT family N-acetyltransferase [Haliea sp. SAOS-164]
MSDSIRKAEAGDLDRLLELEQACFSTDRLSRRSFRRWLRHEHCVFLVAVDRKAQVQGYALAVLRQGTRLARLYSVAVDPAQRGRGLAAELIAAAERGARAAGALYMRLEVATGNQAAIKLYKRMGYRRFGLYRDYYDDHGDALRMEKIVHAYEEGQSRIIPWFPQSTAFTCGPASLMMAMAALDKAYVPGHMDEIQIWREATTIFMTSGHGGCHPIGLALAASRRGFSASVRVNQHGPLFLEGVRDPNKKRVMSLVHDSFVAQAAQCGVDIDYGNVEQQALIDAFNTGASLLVLISTYRLDKKKAPHWVVVSGSDERCLFVQDPGYEIDIATEPADAGLLAMDYQHIPIAREDFAAMSRFGASRLQAAVVLRREARA